MMFTWNIQTQDSQMEILDRWFLCIILNTFPQNSAGHIKYCIFWNTGICGFEHEFVTILQSFTVQLKLQEIT